MSVATVELDLSDVSPTLLPFIESYQRIREMPFFSQVDRSFGGEMELGDIFLANPPSEVGVPFLHGSSRIGEIYIERFEGGLFGLSYQGFVTPGFFARSNLQPGPLDFLFDLSLSGNPLSRCEITSLCWEKAENEPSCYEPRLSEHVSNMKLSEVLDGVKVAGSHNGFGSVRNRDGSLDDRRVSFSCIPDLDALIRSCSVDGCLSSLEGFYLKALSNDLEGVFGFSLYHEQSSPSTPLCTFSFSVGEDFLFHRQHQGTPLDFHVAASKDNGLIAQEFYSTISLPKLGFCLSEAICEYVGFGEMRSIKYTDIFVVDSDRDRKLVQESLYRKYDAFALERGYVDHGTHYAKEMH